MTTILYTIIAFLAGYNLHMMFYAAIALWFLVRAIHAHRSRKHEDAREHGAQCLVHAILALIAK